MEGLHGFVPDAANLARRAATAFRVGGDIVIPVRNGCRITSIHAIARDVLVVLRVLQESKTELLDVGRAGDGVGFFAGLRKGGEEHGGQNRDDGDNDQ